LSCPRSRTASKRLNHELLVPFGARSHEEIHGFGRWTHLASRAGRNDSVSAAGPQHDRQGQRRQLCTVEPLGDYELAAGDIVLCKVKGSQYLHLVKTIQGERFQIGNNRGLINGWISRRQIYGRLIRVE
jgi:hypothetical protein